MSENHEINGEIEQEAAHWVVRAQGGAMLDSDLDAFEAWLDRSPAHADAYGQALLIWDQVETLKAFDAPAIQTSSVIDLASRRHRRMAARPSLWMGGAVAAAIALLIAVPVLLNQPHDVIYSTVKGEHKSVTLADGTVLDLNTNTRIAVRMGHDRRVTLQQGELALHVAHDEKHPFRVVADDVTVTDVGTVFDVLSDAGAVKVAVREGEVSMAGRNTGAINLHAGEMAMRGEGDTHIVRLAGSAEEAFAWQSRHAIYRDLPLSVVARDLNRYFDKPLVVDARSGQLKLTAILTLDSETAVVGRLQDFLPLDAKSTDKAIYLSASTSGRKPGA